jgi:hypothetical protein
MTDRTRFLRRQSLEPDDAKLVDDVEEYGCHIIQVRGEIKEKTKWASTLDGILLGRSPR